MLVLAVGGGDGDVSTVFLGYVGPRLYGGALRFLSWVFGIG